MKTVDANRLKIWQALSELFLDTEITDATFDYVARVVLETGLNRLGFSRHLASSLRNVFQTLPVTADC
ncbi:hypothetical protein DNF23_35635 [Pseudomonas syringae pv. pisi]|uniref:DUF7079 family protein n=1 Tax=Pseudomonas syringae TaxID=317 RepID=UPI0009B0D31E